MVTDNITPGSPFQWYELGVSLRAAARFGEAINAFMRAVQDADALLEEPGTGEQAREELESVRSRAAASIELIREIISFVNKDLMNP